MVPFYFGLFAEMKEIGDFKRGGGNIQNFELGYNEECISMSLFIVINFKLGWNQDKLRDI